MINLLSNLKRILNFSKVVKVKKKKLKIFISFLFINFVILSDLLIISILNFIITNNVSEDNIFNFLFSPNSEIYLIIFIITRYVFLFLDHILRESLRLDLDKSLKLKSVTDLFDESAKDVSIVSYEVNNEATMLGLLYKNLISLLTNSFQFITFLIYIIFVDVSVTLFLVIIGVLSSSIIYYQKRKNLKTSENYQMSLEEINSESLDLASNFYLIKILNIEDKVWKSKSVLLSTEQDSNQRVNDFQLSTNINFQDINSLFSNLTSLSIFELNELKNKYNDINYSSIEVDSAIQKIFSFPFYLMLMTILFSTIMLNIKQNRTKIFHLIFGILISVIIYYLSFFFEELGKNEQVPVLVSIWIPLLMISIVSVINLVRINEK